MSEEKKENVELKVGNCFCGKHVSFRTIRIASGATIDDDYFIIEGTTFLICPECGVMFIDFESIKKPDPVPIEDIEKKLK